MKKCFKCAETKPIELFYKHVGMLDGHLNKCRSCCLIESKNTFNKTDKLKWNKDKRDRYPRNRIKQKDTRYKNMCGVGIDWVELKHREQKGLCAICEKPGILVLDHDHRTKKPRGLIHRKCNSAIGLLGDNFELLVKAAKYIQEHDKVEI